ncbi:fungal specific transcription factor domain-containing protein [Aspergillus aculeatinus CBS 121060]|uniref:Uncharacterized protein n=1 Tax=Aspergillus aculeatinus CBS 121060 TaxID=1448322 RepID=A0ACD1GRC7_9EURO|nr:hypothetical protein BO66DRAFT_258389 [Aspergillus aculeatinus CBS 121060]RAH63874.1 hypothetical protein BO66DRAFT_258389 [Aspergillus aculeatinus CBS 121060]
MQQGLQCTFDRNHRFNQPSSTDDHELLFPMGEQQQASEGPANGSTAQVKSPSDSNTQRGSSHRSPVAIDHIMGHVPTHLRASNGLPFFTTESRQWMESRTGQTIDFDRLSLNSPRRQSQSVGGLATTREYFQTHDHPDLPDRSKVLLVFQSFRRFWVHRFFPLLHPDLFHYTMEAAYENKASDASPDPSTARACIFAFMAFMNSWPFGQALPDDNNIQEYGYQAQYLLSETLDGAATIDGIQALLMLSLFRLLRFSAPNSVDLVFQASVRHIFTLGGHLHRHVQKSPTVFNLHCRFLFWLAYLCDRELSLRTGRPPAICDDHCDLTLPDEDELAMEFGYHDHQTPANLNLAFFFPTDIRLSLVQSKITRKLYSPQAALASDAELLKTVRELDDGLNEWYRSLQLPNNDQGVVFTQEEIYLRSCLLQLQHQYCIAAIHQMSTGCAAWIADPSSRALGITLSLEVAANASRALLRQFLVMQDALAQEVFWFEIYYVLSGVMNLFCKVLNDPGDSQTLDDVHLLDTIAARFSRAAGSHTYFGYCVDVHLMRDFVAELCRLARCAISRRRQ